MAFAYRTSLVSTYYLAVLTSSIFTGAKTDFSLKPLRDARKDCRGASLSIIIDNLVFLYYITAVQAVSHSFEEQIYSLKQVLVEHCVKDRLLL